MEDLISVIIPVYNAELYLRECLNSVLVSTYKNLEIILVDDGSTDDCPRICDEYASKDNRIIVIHQENQGLSAARNVGITYAKGKYIGFVDSDDVISPIMYELLYETLKIANSDMSACEYTRNIKKMDFIYDFFDLKISEVTSYNDRISVIVGTPTADEYPWIYCTVWNKLYRRDKIIKQFEVGISPSEDLLFNFFYVQKIEKISIVPKILYFYRENPESIMHVPSIDKSICAALVYQKIAQEVCNEKIEMRDYILRLAAYFTHNVLWKIEGAGSIKLYPEFVKQSRGVIKNYFKELIFSRETEWKVRIPAILFKYCEPIWKIAARIYLRQ